MSDPGRFQARAGHRPPPRPRGGARRLVALAAALLGAACGHSYITPETPSLLNPNQPRSDDPSMSIGAAGVTPTVLHLNAPVTVTFTNNDGVAHTLAPAPELGYGTCADIDSLGRLEPGQRGTVRLTQVSYICGFHDVAAPSNRAFQGLIVLH